MILQSMRVDSFLSLERFGKSYQQPMQSEEQEAEFAASSSSIRHDWAPILSRISRLVKWCNQRARGITDKSDLWQDDHIVLWVQYVFSNIKTICFIQQQLDNKCN